MDTRIARLGMSRDPLYKKFPSQSPFIFGGNNPIYYVDKKGEKKTVYTTILRDNKPPIVVTYEDVNKYKYVNTYDGFVMTNYSVNQVLDLRKNTKSQNRFYQSDEIPNETVNAGEMVSTAFTSIIDKIDPHIKVMVFGSGRDYADWLKNPRPRKSDKVISIDFKKLDGLFGDILTGMVSMPEYNAPTGPESFETATEKGVDFLNEKVKDKMNEKVGKSDRVIVCPKCQNAYNEATGERDNAKNYSQEKRDTADKSFHDN